MKKSGFILLLVVILAIGVSLSAPWHAPYVRSLTNFVVGPPSLDEDFPKTPGLRGFSTCSRIRYDQNSKHYELLVKDDWQVLVVIRLKKTEDTKTSKITITQVEKRPDEAIDYSLFHGIEPAHFGSCGPVYNKNAFIKNLTTSLNSNQVLRAYMFSEAER